MDALKDIWWNFTHFRDGKEVPLPVHILFLITFIFGFCFAFYSDFTGATQTVLYTETTVIVHEASTNVWGLCAMLACFVMVIAFQIKSPTLASVGTMFGFMVWLYAATMYIIGGFLFGLIVSAIPNMIFWAWLYFVARKQHRVPRAYERENT